MANIVVTTTSVHDVAAAIYGLWQCFEVLGDHGSDLLADLKLALIPDDKEVVPTVTDQDDVLMLASYAVWEKTVPVDPPASVDGLGRMVTIKTRTTPRRVIVVPPRQRGGSAVPSRKNMDVRAQNMAMITAALQQPTDVAPPSLDVVPGNNSGITDDYGDDDYGDDDYGDDDYGDDGYDDYADQVGFIGPAIRAACMGAAILFRRVGARAALGVVASFAKKGASRLATLARSAGTKALATTASKYLLVAGAIAVGERFVVATAKNVASGATAVGKGALWLIAAFAAYTFLADHRRKKSY